MYKCLECGCEFEQPLDWVENAGAFSSCPNCGGDYEEMVQCRLCDNYHTEDEMVGEVCKHCFENLAPADMVAIGIHDKQEIELNGFLASVFDSEDINELMLTAFNQLPEEEKERFKREYVSLYPDEVSDAYIEAVEGGDL